MSKASSVLIYGESGSAKTTSAKFLAKYIYEKTGKTTRLITADGGGTDPIQPEIDAGLIDVFNISQLEEPIATMRKLSRGQWPLQDGKLGAVDTSQIGAYVIEGLTSIGDLVIRDFRLKGTKLSQEPGFKFQEGGETFYGSNMTYYGFAQEFLQEIAGSFNTLDVDRILWTALESRGEDGDTRMLVYGPTIVGKKSLAKAPAWFGTCIHHEVLTKETGKVDQSTKTKILETEIRGYFTKHPDNLGIIFPAKTRLSSEAIPELLKKFPNGYFPITLTEGLDNYLKAEENLTTTRGADVRAWMENRKKQSGASV